MDRVAQYNKAIIALIMGGIAVANAFWPGAVGIQESTVNIIVGAITPILVYLIPNKAKQ